MVYDLVIIGGGPGAVAAGVYAARKKISSALVTETFGGQSVVSGDIQNWIGTPSISGFDLAENLEKHLRAQEGVEIIAGELADKIVELTDGNLETTTSSGKKIISRFALIATGGHHRKLDIPGEKEFDGKGVAYCSTCDAPLFRDRVVAVIGGGNAGLEAVLDLLPYASKVYLMLRGESPRGDAATFEKIKTNPKVEIMTQVEAISISGADFVSGMRYQDKKDGSEKNLDVQGVFVEIGTSPNSEFVKDLVSLSERGEIIVDPKTQRTSNPKIWAAGDVTDGLYKQNNISAGDAVKAILSIQGELHKN